MTGFASPLAKNHPTSRSWSHFLRSVFLLMSLLIILGLAVCWNVLPPFFEQMTVAGVEKAASDDFTAPFLYADADNSEQLALHSPPAFSPPPPSFLPNDHSNDAFNDDSGEYPDSELEAHQRLHSEPIAYQDGYQSEASVRPREYLDTDNRIVTVMPTSYPANAVYPTNTVHPTAIPANAQSSAPPSTPSDLALGDFETELERLGARHCRLENWDAQGRIYRFSCVVPASQPYRYQKHFQELGTNPSQLVSAVMEQIRQWQEKENMIP